ncbi:MAG: hypothetical protein HQ507_03785 [Candidatus Marinimicrobia bacterium]|nr:hypothetical protein [Candidatus Neomarinimicrobiota bacterium]
MKYKFLLVTLVLIPLLSTTFGQKGVKEEHPLHYGMELVEFVSWYKAPQSILEFNFGPNMDKLTIHILDIKKRPIFYAFRNNQLYFWGYLEEFAQSDKGELVALAGEIRPRISELLEKNVQVKLFKNLTGQDLLYPGYSAAKVAEILENEKLAGKLSVFNGASETEFTYGVYVAKRNNYGVPYLTVFENDQLKYWGYFEDFNKSFDLTKNRINHELRDTVYNLIAGELFSNN